MSLCAQEVRRSVGRSVWSSDVVVKWETRGRHDDNMIGRVACPYLNGRPSARACAALHAKQYSSTLSTSR